MKNKIEMKITDNPCTVTNTHDNISSSWKKKNPASTSDGMCVQTPYTIRTWCRLLLSREVHIFTYSLLQAVSHNMERVTFLFVLSIKTKNKWRDWVAVRWRSIQRWEKEQKWERDSNEIRTAACATNAKKSIGRCCSVAALWRPMKLDRISSKTNLRLYNNKVQEI